MKQDPGAERGRKNNVTDKSGLQECRSPSTEPSLATAHPGKAFPSHAEEEEREEGVFWLAQGGVEGLTPPLSATAAPSSWEGELGIKTWGVVSRRSIPLFSRAGFAPSCWSSHHKGPGVLNPSRNDPQGDEGSQHPALHRGAQTEGHIQPDELREPQNNILKKGKEQSFQEI